MRRSRWLIGGFSVTIAIIALLLMRSDNERRQFQDEQHAAQVDAAGYQAWLSAIQYQRFWVQLANASAQYRIPRPDLFLQDSYYIKPYQRSDVRFVGRSTRTGNDSFEVSAIIGVRHEIPDYMKPDYLNRNSKGVTEEQFRDGVWRYFAMKMVTHKMDAPGQWLTDTAVIVPSDYKNDLPMQRINSDLPR